MWSIGQPMISQGLLYEVKKFMPKNFDMKDMSNASYIIDIKIHRDRPQGILGLP